MAGWTPQDLDRIGSAVEIEIAPCRPDGTLRPYTTIWIVRVGKDLFVRSYRGADGSWFRAGQRTRAARVRAGGVERDVTLQEADSAETAAVDEAYRAKYGRSSYVDAMVSGAAAATTLRIVPR